MQTRKYWMITNMPEEGIEIVLKYAQENGMKVGFAITKLVKEATNAEN